MKAIFIGRESADSGEEVQVLMAFLSPEEHREKCRVGVRFDLVAGARPFATGTMEALVVREKGRV